MKENGLEYEEIKKLLSIKAKNEYVRVDYCEVSYYEYEQEVNYIETRPCLIDIGHIVCELIEDKKVRFCDVIEDREVEKVVFCEAIEYQEAGLIEDQKVELIEKVVFCEEIEDKNVEFCELIED